jgi:hypothetical protein
MKISAFTFVRNADKLYIPVKESILSALDLVDEYVIALGNNDEDDTTEDLINSIGSEKIKLIRTEWNSEKYPKNTEYAHQTDIAKQYCTGDWLLYLQCDEALHEKDHAELRMAMQTHLKNDKVEGFLFHFLHFWGDYEHVHDSHVWYKKEIRIIRNHPSIHSWKDAQSFRLYESFEENNYKEYQRSEGTRKLQVVQLNAQVYHYGFTRPPEIMSGKKKKTFATYHGAEKGKALLKNLPEAYDYGPLQHIPKFNGSHPKAMAPWIKDFHWKDQLQYSGRRRTDREIHKHERLKYRIISFLENTLLGGDSLFDFKNYKKIKA